MNTEKNSFLLDILEQLIAKDRSNVASLELGIEQLIRFRGFERAEIDGAMKSIEKSDEAQKRISAIVRVYERKRAKRGK